MGATFLKSAQTVRNVVAGLNAFQITLESCLQDQIGDTRRKQEREIKVMSRGQAGGFDQ